MNIRDDELRAVRSLVATYPDAPESFILGRLLQRHDRAEERKAEQKARQKPRNRPKGNPIPDAVRAAVRRRSTGICEAHTPWCEWNATQVHHVDQNRKNNAPSNLLHVCGMGNASGCHGWIHQHPAEAKELGLLGTRHARNEVG